MAELDICQAYRVLAAGIGEWAEITQAETKVLIPLCNSHSVVMVRP